MATPGRLVGTVISLIGGSLCQVYIHIRLCLTPPPSIPLLPPLFAVCVSAFEMFLLSLLRLQLRLHLRQLHGMTSATTRPPCLPPF